MEIHLRVHMSKRTERLEITRANHQRAMKMMGKYNGNCGRNLYKTFFFFLIGITKCYRLYKSSISTFGIGFYKKPTGVDMKQSLPINNCEGAELHATTTLCTIYRLLTSGENIGLDIADDEVVQYYGFTAEDWYRGWCLLRYNWRERSREGPEGDGASKKQNKTAEKPIYFTRGKLRKYKQNPKDAIQAADQEDDEESGYETDADDKELLRLIAIGRAIWDDHFNLDIYLKNKTSLTIEMLLEILRWDFKIVG